MSSGDHLLQFKSCRVRPNGQLEGIYDGGVVSASPIHNTQIHSYRAVFGRDFQLSHGRDLREDGGAATVVLYGRRKLYEAVTSEHFNEFPSRVLAVTARESHNHVLQIPPSQSDLVARLECRLGQVSLL